MRSLVVVSMVSWFSIASHGQVMEGEVRVTVRDPAGRPVPAAVLLSARIPEVEIRNIAAVDGEARLVRLSPGTYRLTIVHPGFEIWAQPIEIRSAVPISVNVSLKVSQINAEIVVRDDTSLLTPHEPTPVLRVGRRQLEDTFGTTLGRSLIDVITQLPGWLLEANAVLHPRGSEYDTQFVVDGMPLYENRSLAFAPPFAAEEFEAVSVMTGGIPAEYGRRLGGVITLNTRRSVAKGHASEFGLLAGSYGTYLASLSHRFSTGRNFVSAEGHGGVTDRYLDPPSPENFTNNASSGGGQVRMDRDLTETERLSLYIRSGRTGFRVPNNLEGQASGQRQDRSTGETAFQAHYLRTISPGTVATLRGMVRRMSATLRSNSAATPVWVDQDRGFTEGAFIGTVTAERERHTVKAGGDVRFNRIRERLGIAEPDDLSELTLNFRDNRRSTDAALFLQDEWRYRDFTLAAGLRYDYYHLFSSDHSLSPRLAAAYYLRSAGVIVRASYDRIFQPPPLENLLLSTAAAGLPIAGVEGGLAIPASRGHFAEVGIQKSIAGKVRVDASHYWRSFRNYLDDDVFLNTGISFPITFDKARIEGTEVRLEMPRWRSVSSFISYSNMLGRARSPVTGGLFIEGSEAEELRNVAREFAISQDQRNTVAAQMRFEPHQRIWLSAAGRYGSGLPVELENDEDEDDEHENGNSPVPQAVLDKVNFQRGRLRPLLSLDIGAALRIWERHGRSTLLQMDCRNVTDRLNVVNFSGLFSGTAIAPGRQVSARLRLQF